MIKIGGFFLSNHDPNPPLSHPRFYFRHIRTVYKSVRFPPPTRPEGFYTSISTPDCLNNVHQRPTHTKNKKNNTKNSCRLSVRRSAYVYFSLFVFVYGKVGNSDNETGIKMFGLTCSFSTSECCVIQFERKPNEKKKRIKAPPVM